MKKIFVRSPYFIEINEEDQTSGKIELYFWNKGTSMPELPNYTLTKQIPSALQTKLTWNVSNFAKEFIKPVNPVSVSLPTEENTSVWCYMRVVSYSNDVEINDETFVCLNGYTQFMDGYNYYNDGIVVPLVATSVKIKKTPSPIPYVNVFYEQGEYEIIGVGTLSVGEPTMYKLPLTADLNGDDYYEYYSEFICEPKYTPIVCNYINKYGGWQFLVFFKANQQSIEVKSNTFNLMPQSTNYNTYIGSNKNFNFNGTQKITCNTGWVNENYFQLIQDLMVSETILLDGVPVICKSNSSDIKTHLKEKNINYTINFEYNFNLINDVV